VTIKKTAASILTIDPEDDAARVFETSMNYKMERHNIPDYSTLDIHCCENLISNNITIDLPALLPPPLPAL
jgi:hypothetical protein